MAKCVNCTADATYEYVITPRASQLYCATHAPRGLKGTLNFKIYEEPVVEAPKTTSKKKAATPVVEEPVVEEAPVEETPTEE